MKRLLVSILFLFCSFCCLGQSTYHVFPANHELTPGKQSGNGSLNSPWDLQTALSNKQNRIKAGDVIYLHEGTYNGRYVSNLNSNSEKITVSAFQNDKVILNGNVKSKRIAVLEVNGGNIIFKKFEITFLGDFIRSENNPEFISIYGINHRTGVNCEFLNLKIHNNPGSGIGSWNKTGGSLIKNCLVFNNGFQGKKRGRGVGIYVQNSTDLIKIIANNYIFNNWYKGIEVWSANTNANYEYIKNISLNNNILFNNGLPSYKHYDNLIIATDDRNSINIARNINVINNIFYHNTNILESQINGSAPSLTLGFNVKAPVQSISVKNNVIIGRNNALRILHAKSIYFINNIVYSGYVHLGKSYNKIQEKWNFSNNNYYTKKEKVFRFNTNTSFYNLEKWQRDITKDDNSSWSHLRNFNTRNVLSITTLNSNNNLFRVTLFNKNGQSVDVDFLDYKIKKGTYYTIRNIENDSIITSGNVSDSLKVTFPMGTYNQTADNFGVYSIEFNEESKRKRKNFFRRLFGWLF